MTNLEEALNRSIEAFRAACEIISKASDPEAKKPPQVSPDNAIWSCFYIGDNTPSNKYSQMIADILGAELRAVPKDSEITANTVFDVPDTTLDNYNFSDLNPRTQRTLVTLLVGLYSGANHYAQNNNMPLEVAEMTFSRGCLDISHSISESEISELVASIDKYETSLFSSDMSEKMWNWAKAQEAAAKAQEDDEDEDFSFIDEDDLIDFLTNSVSIEDFEAGVADE